MYDYVYIIYAFCVVARGALHSKISHALVTKAETAKVHFTLEGQGLRPQRNHRG
jgi:hypothetical protein